MTLRHDAESIVRAALAAVDPERLVVRALERERHQRIHVLCAGKAAAAMAAGARRALGQRIVSGLIVSPEPVAAPPAFEVIEGAHPLPTLESARAGRRALELAVSVREGERFLVLLSGGASALMAAPAAGVSLDDKIETTSRLLKAGAAITELNSVRKHLSDIKGGGLALRSIAGCHTLAISDVVGDDLAVIGSGPGMPDASRFADALAALRQFGGLDVYPRAVVDRLNAGDRGELPETLKPSDPRAGRATGSVIGSRMDAMDGAGEAARRLGYHVVRIERAIVGEARDAAQGYMRELEEQTAAHDEPLCVVSSGETTVRVTGAGSGGRNQEFALAALESLAALGSGVTLASAGTDGVDGPTDAAGAFVDQGSLARARRLGLEPSAFLLRNDSHAFFAALGDLFVTGPTGTNVGDLQVALIDRAGGTASRAFATP